MSIIKQTDTPDLLAEAVSQAAALLRAGEVVVLPTETVYGLAADARNVRAVERIFQIKGRPAHNPIIVHVAGLEMARQCAAHWPLEADKLARSFWPGPLTLVLPRAPEIPDIVTAGGSTVGVRWPAHPVFEAVIQACGFPLAAPSANPSGQISPTSAGHAARTLGDRVPLILDGGPCEIGIESTVLDLSVSPPRVLRPGIIHAESLAAVIGRLATHGRQPVGPLRSPGQLPKHYAPKARLRVWDGTAKSLTDILREPGIAPNRVHVLVRSSRLSANVGHICTMPREPRPFARALYAEWHRADEAGAELILLEALPEGEEWQAIADRVARAAAT